MRIAIFTDTYLPGKNGISMSIDSFTRLMAADGHQIQVFCPKKGRFHDKPIPNISVVRYASVTAPSYKDIKLSLPFIWRAVKDLKKFKPDVVHIQTPMGIGLVGIWATKILKLKNIQTYHTYLPDFLMYVNPKNLLGISKITRYINNSRLAKSIILEADDLENNPNWSKFKKRLKKIIKEILGSDDEDEDRRKFKDIIGENYTRLVYNRADLVLTPSKALKHILKDQGVRTRVEVMSNGVDNSLFKKKTDYTITNRIVYTGRLGDEKSVEVVIEAFYIAQKIKPQLRLDIYGDGPARKNLHSLTKKLGMTRKIKFLGSYDIQKVSQKLCEYDFFVTASAIETQGIVMLEAMSSGLPVVAVNKLATPEIVRNRKNGYLSEAFDAAGMAENILKMLESKRKLEKFGRQSILMAESHEIIKCKELLLQKYKRIAK